MNILYILSTTEMDGSVQSALTLIEEMRKRSYGVVILCPFLTDSFRRLLEHLEVKYYVARFCLNAYPKYYHGIIDWLWQFSKIRVIEVLSVFAITKIIKSEHINIVHTNVGPITCGYKAASRMRIPHIWHIREYGDRDFNIKMFPSKEYFRKKLQRSNVITITKDLLFYNHLETSPKAKVIYNGVRRVDEKYFDGNKERFFLCASRVSPEKGFDQIIRVFALFVKSNPEYKLVILGKCNSEYLRALQIKANELGVTHAIDFLGFKENVSDYMYTAKALLVASLSEGFGRMTAEAAFAGCLVIGKDTAGTKEILDITGGYPFISDDDMLNAMKDVSMLSNDSYREKALYAQQKALQYFSKENYVNQVIEFYKSAQCNA